MYCENQVQQALLESGITKLYHFTDARNIGSIKRLGGLYSWCYLMQKGFDPEYFGGNELSRRLDGYRGLANYVHLSFCEDHPMRYRLQQSGRDIRLLEINLSVINERTKFSDINATSTNANIGEGLSGFQNVNVRAVQRTYVKRTDPDFELHQAEALILRCVPLSAIMNIGF